MSSASVVPGSALIAYAGSWSLDPAATTMEFHTKAVWVMPVTGTVRALSGSADVGEDGSVTGRLVLDAKSIGTGNKKRDAHLQTADFFETDKYPTMDFDVTGGRLDGTGRAELDGTLTIRGQSRPVTLVATVTGDNSAVILAGQVDDIDRKQWGLEWAKMGAGTHNRVMVKARFTRA